MAQKIQRKERRGSLKSERMLFNAKPIQHRIPEKAFKASKRKAIAEQQRLAFTQNNETGSIKPSKKRTSNKHHREYFTQIINDSPHKSKYQKSVQKSARKKRQYADTSEHQRSPKKSVFQRQRHRTKVRNHMEYQNSSSSDYEIEIIKSKKKRNKKKRKNQMKIKTRQTKLTETFAIDSDDVPLMQSVKKNTNKYPLPNGLQLKYLLNIQETKKLNILTLENQPIIEWASGNKTHDLRSTQIIADEGAMFGFVCTATGMNATTEVDKKKRLDKYHLTQLYMYIGIKQITEADLTRKSVKKKVALSDPKEYVKNQRSKGHKYEKLYLIEFRGPYDIQPIIIYSRGQSRRCAFIKPPNKGIKNYAEYAKIKETNPPSVMFSDLKMNK